MCDDMKDTYSLEQYQAEIGKNDEHNFEVMARFCYGSVLDVGCGNGKLELYLNDNTTYIGLDTAGNVTIQGDLYELPFPDRSFNTVVLSAVLEHLEQPIMALREIKRVAKDRILLSVPNVYGLMMLLPNLFYHEIRDRNHLQMYTDNEIKAICARVNLKYVKKIALKIEIPVIRKLIPVYSTVIGRSNMYLLEQIKKSDVQ